MIHRITPIVLVAAALLTPPSIARADDKPRLNFVFILVDDWGWTDAAFAGSDLYRTPHMDKLAADGVRFTSGYAACTVCSPSRAAAMTGQYPARLRVTDWIAGHVPKNAPLSPPDWTMRLEHRHVTVAQRLRDAGYHTASIGKWHLTPPGDDAQLVESHYPDRHGFEVNVAGNRWGQPGSYHWPYASDRNSGRLGMTAAFPEGGKEGDFLSDMLTDQAVTLIEKWRDEPFFIYLPHYAVHTPIQGKAGVVEKYKALVKDGGRHTNATYAALVESVDDSVGKLRATLDRLGIADRTVIVLTGDNGGLTIRDGPTNNAPLRAGKGSAYEGGVRVPTVLYAPGVTPKGATCDEPVITVDVMPTLLEMAGVKHEGVIDGLSLVPLLRDPAGKLDREAIYWHYPHYHPGGAEPYSAIRAGDWRLVEFQHSGKIELYHLADDIGETKDLASAMPEKAAELRAKLHAWRKSVDAQMAVPNPTYKP